MNRRNFLATAALPGPALLSGAQTRPNILFCVSDNHSWPHLSVNGAKGVLTPNCDRVAREGVRFTNAFCSAPSCSPSRGAMLTGQDIWRLEEGANLWGTLPAKFPVYPELLENAGYQIGQTGKGYGPAKVEAGGRTRSPLGPSYRSFYEFLNARSSDKPFFFWFGGFDTEKGRTAPPARHIRPADIEVPPFLPDNQVVRDDLVQYLHTVEYFDRGVGVQLEHLRRAGILENTLIVVTSDNGMGFPRCYPNLYDFGTREFLAVRWPANIKPNRVCDDFVNLMDFAPTFLELAGLKPPPMMTARSLQQVLTSPKSGRIDPARSHVITGRERHDYCRPGGVGYPMRGIRTSQFLYIRNYEPDRWPAGDPDLPTAKEGVFGDIDRSETKSFMMQHRNHPKIRPLFDLAFGKRPAEELYDLATDPYQMRNVASESSFSKAKLDLAARLQSYLKQSNDPRAVGAKPLFDTYTYYGAKGF